MTSWVSFRGVRTTHRILLEGLSGCPARSGSLKRNPATSGGCATTYRREVGLLCPPASSSQLGMPPFTTDVDPHPSAKAVAAADGVALAGADGVALTGEGVGVGRVAAWLEHATSTTETIVAIAALMARIPRSLPIGSSVAAGKTPNAASVHSQPPPTGRAGCRRASSLRCAGGVRPRRAGRGGGAGAWSHPARAST